MRRILPVMVALLVLPLSADSYGWDSGAGLQRAEAAGVRVADRELKRNKSDDSSGVYERAHSIIWNRRGGNQAVDDRVRIAVVINGDENIVVEDRIKNQIYSQLRKKFPIENFAVMKGTDVNTRLLEEAEDRYYDNRGTFTVSREATKRLHGTPSGPVSAVLGGVGDFLIGRRKAQDAGIGSPVTKTDKLDIDGMAVGLQPRGLADMRKSDYVAVGRELGYDYVFVVTMSNGMSENDKHNFVVFNSTSNHKNVWLRVRFVDVANNAYLYRNDIPAQGETHNGTINGRILERSIEKAMKEAMDDIAVEY